MKHLSRIYTAIIMIFLFAPIAVLLVFSFNGANSLSVMSGFSLHWYRELLRDSNTLISLRNTLVLALSSAFIATVMGTGAAVGIDKLRSRTALTVYDTVTNIPMTNPDIITGISLMLMFVFTGRLIGSTSSLNFATMLIAHITFCLPYVILQVLPRLSQMDRALPEAAMDLGCTPVRAFFKVVFPEIMPGVLTGLIMSFTLSVDDFVISYFTAGNGFETLPIRIYSMTKKTVTPKMYALATIIFFTIMALLIINNVMSDDQRAQARERRKARLPMSSTADMLTDAETVASPAKGRSRKLSDRGKLAVVACLIAVCLLLIIVPPALIDSDMQTLNVYNWGEYIADGSEEFMDVVSEFEDWYYDNYGRRVNVNYTTYATNEDMYAKLKSGAVSYDVIVPSDYMIARLIEEDMLLEIDFGNIPNYENIGEEYRYLYFDPEARYSVPYIYNINAIIYDANVVDEEDAQGWDLLWNPKYAGKILQYNNPRDAFGTAMYKLGIDANTTDPDEWNRALEELLRQRPLVKAYVMDEVFNLMESGEAAIACYYGGDYFLMSDAASEDVDLQLYYPDPTCYFMDSMCIPSCCQNKELAEIFINFLLEEDVAVQNAEYISYSSPNVLVQESEEYADYMGEEAMEALYPEIDDFTELYNANSFRNQDSATMDLMNSLWEALKIQ